MVHLSRTEEPCHISFLPRTREPVAQKRENSFGAREIYTFYSKMTLNPKLSAP